MMLQLTLVLLCLVILLLVAVLYLLNQLNKGDKMEKLITSLNKEEFAENRAELQKSIKDNSASLTQSIGLFQSSFNDQLKLISDTQLKALSSLTERLETQLSKMDFNQKASSKEGREELFKHKRVTRVF